MNRLSSEEWVKEQNKDDNSLPPITLEAIEKGISYQSIKTMYASENGKNNYNSLNDIQLCDLIDNEILALFPYSSVYQMSAYDLQRASDMLRRQYHLPESQIRRCLAICQ